MQSRLTRALLCVALIFSTIGAGKCNSSKLDRVVLSLEVAASIPSFPAEVRAGFTETATALKTVRENPNAATWQHALTVFDGLQARGVFRLGDASTQATIAGIVAAVRVLLDSAAPRVTDASDGARATPDAGKLNESDVKELERRVRAAKE